MIRITTDCQASCGDPATISGWKDTKKYDYGKIGTLKWADVGCKWRTKMPNLAAIRSPTLKYWHGEKVN